MTTLTIHDQTTFGRNIKTFRLEIPAEKATVRDLIERRVREEVERFNREQHDNVFRGLVQPTDAELTLNGYKLRKVRHIDWREQADAAVEAFGRNGFLLLVDDRQVDALDEVITLRPDTTLHFLKLIPLVGG